jgi:hypothetical protein
MNPLLGIFLPAPRSLGFGRAIWGATLLASVALSSHSEAAAPGWWSSRGVLTASTADDYSIANQGQLKNLTQAAIAELDAALTGGAGTALHNLLTSWQSPAPLPAAQPNDYAILNNGQLKEVVRLVYDRMVAAGKLPAYAAGMYPWTSAQADDYAPVNSGQLKHAFDFDFTIADRDGDGLNDLLELVAFHTSPETPHSDGNGVPDALEDSDGDGILNIDEMRFGLNPAVNDSNSQANYAGYTYDNLSRLTKASPLVGSATNVTFDNEGNILTIAP